jgi:VanZ family protein
VHINQERVGIIALFVLILMLAALFILGSQPWAGSLFPAPWDKVIHFIFYGTVAVLLSLAFPSLAMPAILLIALGVGAVDEYHQIFVPGRHAGLDDLAADFIGIATTLLIIPRLRKIILSESKSQK